MNRSKRIAISGILCALSALMLIAAGTVPSGRLALLCLAAGFVTVICIECGKGFALLGYVVSCIIAAIFSPNKMMVLLFGGIVGYYPVLKLLIEQKRNLLTEWIMKILLFALVLVLTVLCTGVFFQGVVLPLPKPCLVGAGIITGVIYDVALSLFIQFYKERIAGIIRNGVKK